MPFLPPNQQRQSTEGRRRNKIRKLAKPGLPRKWPLKMQVTVLSVHSITAQRPVVFWNTLKKHFKNEKFSFIG